VNRHAPNLFLRSLPPEDFEKLNPSLRPVELKLESVLVAAGEPLENVYFPSGGFISLVTILAGGETLEVAMIGRDSFFGPMPALNNGLALNDAIVQLAGSAFMMEIEAFRAAARLSPALRDAIIQHEQALFAQALQSAPCCAFHTVEARMARWLLRASDISNSANLTLTQDFLSQMLGTRRSSVSLVANTLHRAGLIRYARGNIEIINREGLMDSACECYGVIKAHYDRLAPTPRMEV
jgi:CRP-like cAMP-binding protein